MTVDIASAAIDFQDWSGLLELLHAAFAFHAGRIDPPSSLHQFDATSIAFKAKEEELFVAVEGNELLGCVFAKSQGRALYIGKFAVRPDRQGQGIGRRLIGAVEAYAQHTGHDALELKTRIELTENHRAFAALGFVKIGEHSHPGYDRNTSITMRKALA